MDFSPSFLDYRLCQVSAPTDVGSAITNARVLRGPAHPLLRVQNQTQKENQRMEKRTTEDCFPHASCHPLGVGPFGNLATAPPSTWAWDWGLQVWLPNRALSQGLLRPFLATD